MLRVDDLEVVVAAVDVVLNAAAVGDCNMCNAVGDGEVICVVVVVVTTVVVVVVVGEVKRSILRFKLIQCFKV